MHAQPHCSAHDRVLCLQEFLSHYAFMPNMDHLCISFRSSTHFRPKAYLKEQIMPFFGWIWSGWYPFLQPTSWFSICHFAMGTGTRSWKCLWQCRRLSWASPAWLESPKSNLALYQRTSRLEHVDQRNSRLQCWDIHFLGSNRDKSRGQISHSDRGSSSKAAWKCRQFVQLIVYIANSHAVSSPVIPFICISHNIDWEIWMHDLV